jgi:hypothetical protein
MTALLSPWWSSVPDTRAVRAKELDIRLETWCWSSDAITAHQSCNLRHLAQASNRASFSRPSASLLGIKALSSNRRHLNDLHRHIPVLRTAAMEYFSLKRSNAADRGQSNLSSKVYVRSTKSGKVQKIVRELYLRQDIPCSSHLCRACLEIAPTDYSKKGNSCGTSQKTNLTEYSFPVCLVRYTSCNH